MNSITIAGNVARDMEVRQIGDKSVGSFSVADNQGKDKPAVFWNCNLWGPRADSLLPYILKGSSITVSGTVSQRVWTDKQGVEQKTMEIRVGDVALQGGKRDAAPVKRQQVPAVKYSKPNDILDDDIPFAPLPRKALLSL